MEHATAVCVSERGEVFCWGWSLHGQCASALPSVCTPTRVDPLKGIEIQQISGGLAHTMALSKSGDVYRWHSAFQTLAYAPVLKPEEAECWLR